MNREKEKVYRRMFEDVKDVRDWKLPIFPFGVDMRVYADLYAEAIMYFVGGVEVKPIIVNFEVKGYIISSKSE